MTEPEKQAAHEQLDLLFAHKMEHAWFAAGCSECDRWVKVLTLLTGMFQTVHYFEHQIAFKRAKEKAHEHDA